MPYSLSLSNSDADGDMDEATLPLPPLRAPPERVVGDWERMGDIRPAATLVAPVGEWPGARVSSTVSERNATCLDGEAATPGGLTLLVGEMAAAALPAGEEHAPSDCDDRQTSIGSSNLPLDCERWMQRESVGFHALHPHCAARHVASAPMHPSNNSLASSATPTRKPLQRARTSFDAPFAQAQPVRLRSCVWATQVAAAATQAKHLLPNVGRALLPWVA